MSGFQLAQRQAQRYEAVTSIFMSGSAALIANTCGLEHDHAVLDLACGTGLVARHAWPLIGAGGRVVGTDVNPAMLAVARTVAAERHADVEWIEAAADAQPFDDGCFDRVLCQQGLQFFPDPVAAVAESMRVLASGGQLHATIWASPGRNPYIERQLDLLAQLDPALVPSLSAALPERADESMLRWASEAGCADASIDLIEHTVLLVDVAAFFLQQTASTPWGPSLAELGDEDRDLLAADIAETLAPLRDASGVHHVPFCSYRLTATRG
jgi:ubiquinone/menaquinone biosynthesis C-methylase UbiE